MRIERLGELDNARWCWPPSPTQPAAYPVATLESFPGPVSLQSDHASATGGTTSFLAKPVPGALVSRLHGSAIINSAARENQLGFVAMSQASCHTARAGG